MNLRYWLIAFTLPVAVYAGDLSARKVDPTFLHRFVPDLKPANSDISTGTCQYVAIFGKGDPGAVPNIMRGVVRFGQITIVPHGACKDVSYPSEEQVYVAMSGHGTLVYGEQREPLKPHDFMYLPAGITHGLENAGADAVRVFVMGFKIPKALPPPPRLLIANYDSVKEQILSSHPDSVSYRLLMGNVHSKRDRLAAAHLLTSLYIMEFQPGGTNFPHHHDSEEEIYFLMDGHGDMVAGGGNDGVEGRHAARPGDGYFFRENCTVGFYNSKDGSAHILAVRSLYPRPAL